jgi:hypothetical protein
MITGAHIIVYSKDAQADRDFLREHFGFPHVDAGHGWLIFALPPSELAVHPAEENGTHLFTLICDDVREFVSSCAANGVTCSAIHEERWGSITEVTLPGGGKLGVYQAKHPRPF